MATPLLLNCSHVDAYTRRPYVHLHGRKAETGWLQDPESRLPDLPRNTGALEKAVLSTCRTDVTPRCIGNLIVLLILECLMFIDTSQWEFEPLGSGYKIKKVCTTSCCVTCRDGRFS